MSVYLQAMKVLGEAINKAACVLLFLMFILSGAVYAQAAAERAVQLQLHQGVLARADRNIRHLTVSSPLAAELSYSGAAGSVLHYPRIRQGYTLGFYQYQNTQLGSTLAAMPWLQFPLYHAKRFQADVQLASGAAWHSQPYHPAENNLNNMLGSRLSAALQFKTLLQLALHERWTLQAGLAFTHFSNGALRLPNKGLNLMSVYTGLSYRLGETVSREIAKREALPALRWQIFMAGGMQQMKHINTPRHAFLTISAAYHHVVGRKSGLLLGADIFRNPGMESLLRNGVYPSEEENINIYRAGITAGHALAMGKLSIQTLLGYYVYRPYDVYQPIYQRYALRYRLGAHMVGSVALKAHFGEAEAIEWGIGIGI